MSIATFWESSIIHYRIFIISFCLVKKNLRFSCKQFQTTQQQSYTITCTYVHGQPVTHLWLGMPKSAMLVHKNHLACSVCFIVTYTLYYRHGCRKWDQGGLVPPSFCCHYLGTFSPYKLCPDNVQSLDSFLATYTTIYSYVH